MAKNKEFITYRSGKIDSKRPAVGNEKIIGGGLFKIVKRVTLEFGGRKRAPFVLKEIRLPTFAKPENYRRYYEFWKKLKDASISTLPTMRIEKVKGRESGILETDLTENDNKFCFGSHDVRWKENLRRFPQYKNLTENDLLGLKILISNWEECQNQARQIAVLATRNGIYLEFDAYSLVAAPSKDGKTFYGRIVITDLDESFYPTKKDLDLPLKERNPKEYQSFLRACKEFNVYSFP